jgi:predicted nuclease of predicted toxin-antitoxin system
MSVSLYMDENVHGAITTGLRQREIDVLTVQEDNRSGIVDPEVLDRATELQRVLFSQDDDLVVEANDRQSKGIDFPGVVFARQSRVSIGTCVRDLELIAKLGEPEEFKNRVQFLPL